MALLLALWAAPAGAAQAEGTYRFTDLGAVGSFSIGYGINQHGSVAGFSSGKTWSATLWHHGKITALGDPSPDVGNCQAHGINGEVAVVGECLGDDGYPRAMLWEGGVATVLPTLGGLYGHASGINQAGRVVGRSSLAVLGATHATMWIDGAPTDLGTLPGGTYSEAHAINDKGQVVGYSTNRQGLSRATVWRGAKVIDLGTLGGLNSQALTLNGRGQVAGCSQTGRGHSHATLWNGKAAVDLGTLPGGVTSCAHGLNDAGVSVGYAFVTKAAKYLDRRATMWNGGTTIDLNTLLDDETRAAGWLLLAATAINDHGVITGVATNGIVHDTRAFLLTPAAP
ncbi:MAG: HAF repeat-containing protein [Vitreoscilla sp.]|nr:HAF repeat-containing protein [Vitreoscilla sp.]